MRSLTFDKKKYRDQLKNFGPGPDPGKIKILVPVPRDRDHFADPYSRVIFC